METSANTDHQPGLTGVSRARRDIGGLLRDERFGRDARLLRLQGWRDTALSEAVAAGGAHRLAPGFCALGAAGVAVTGSWLLALALMTTAVVGVVARNHPVEALYNRLAPAIGRSPIPRNRAAKRLGCAIGTVFLGTSALAIGLGAVAVGQVVAAQFAAVALFVTATNVCVPSLLYVGLFGVERSTANRLFRAGTSG